MTDPDPRARYGLAPGHRLQWEEVQDNWVVLYPEGMVRLNGSAAEIVRRCDGETPLAEIVADLERVYGPPDGDSSVAGPIARDVLDLVAAAIEQGWLRPR